MAEYIRYKGHSIKIGTCESLYYTDFGRYDRALKAGELAWDEANDLPQNYARPDSGYRFRFPFPDEDNIPLGKLGYPDHERGLLITIERSEEFAKGDFPALSGRYQVLSRSQPGLVRQLEQANPNNVSEMVDIEIVQQKLIRRDGEERLVLVYRCPYSQECWRIEDWADAKHITEQITKHYITEGGDIAANRFWEQVNERIYMGYQPELVPFAGALSPNH